MSVMKVLCVLCACVCVRASVLTGKGLYCKDPDIGSFHPVNSTWSSTTFCGNYTCKIRKNLSNTTSENITQVVNINDISIDGMDLDQNRTEMDLDQSNAGSETHITIAERPPAVKTILHKDLLNNINDPEARRELLKNIQDKIFKSLSDKEDRYLTEEEITSITALLKVVKKSDLEALFEIYTLAKDIFKEIDATSESHNSNVNSNTDNSREISNTDNATSRIGASVLHPYFYNPLINQWFKADEAEAKMNTPAFHGPLLLKNYYKKHPSAEYIKMATAAPKCNQQITSQNSTRTDRTPEVPSPYHWVIPRPEPRISSLPRPFSYIYQNDATYPYPEVHYSRPISMKTFDISRADTLLTPATAHKSLSETAVKDANSDLLHKILAASKIDVIPLPNWQTKELSKEAIEDVRANVLQKSEKRYNIFPLRRRVKLERVGKVMKLDDELTRRRKRESTNELEKSAEVEYEVFIEKITCSTDLELGFFRVGNQSQPFPACCPVKIQR